MTKKPNSKARLKKAALSFYPEPAMYEALKALSGRTKVPQQVYLREGLDMVLAKHGIQPGKLMAQKLAAFDPARHGGEAMARGGRKGAKR